MLDDEDLQIKQFLIAHQNDTFIGFGRIRQHKDAIELCTLGVIPEFRGKGAGKKLTQELIKKAKSTIYVVSIIPEFFRKLGFEIISEYPSSMHQKHQRCTTQLVVEEEYCVMRL